MESLMRYISRTSRLSSLYRSKKLQKYGLNGIHHTYILNICRNPGITQEQLAKLIFVNKSNVARQLAILEENGYVTRTTCQNDKRQTLVFPTEKAVQIAPVVHAVLGDWNAAILEGFSPEEKEVLVQAMEKIMYKAKEVLDSLDGEKGEDEPPRNDSAAIPKREPEE